MCHPASCAIQKGINGCRMKPTSLRHTGTKRQRHKAEKPVLLYPFAPLFFYAFVLLWLCAYVPLHLCAPLSVTRYLEGSRVKASRQPALQKE